MRLASTVLLACLALSITACGGQEPVGAAVGTWTLDIHGPMKHMLDIADSLAAEHPDKPELRVPAEQRALVTSFRNAAYVLTLSGDGTAALATSGVPDTPDLSVKGTWKQRGEIVEVTLHGSNELQNLRFRHAGVELIEEGRKAVLRRS